MLTAESLHASALALAREDAVLRGVIARHGLPPLWPRRTGFRTLARMILEQQVSLDSAATLFRRLDRTLAGGLNAAPLARAEADTHAARWAPHRATAARIIWHGYLSDRGRS